VTFTRKRRPAASTSCNRGGAAANFPARNASRTPGQLTFGHQRREHKPVGGRPALRVEGALQVPQRNALSEADREPREGDRL
jgi:hypothetical protein